MADTINISQFPPKDSKARIDQYNFNQKLLLGEHFDAFSIKINTEKFNKEYGKLRYIVANFAGLVSKIVSDMLFSEPPKITVENGDQEFLDALIEDNKLNTQNYESAISNSALGDALYKIRVGKRRSTDEDMSLIIEDTTPKIYFPILDQDNSRQEPEIEELMWKIKINGQDYLRKETHRPGEIENELFLMKDEEISEKVPLTFLDNPPEELVKTGTDFNWVFHVPNWRIGSKYFGYSDYKDITTLIYGLNNRISKIDNILDKHSDPILALPEGILDEEGKIKRGSLTMFEKPEGTDAKPEYVVWNASLESAFKEIEKLVELLFMVSEISPDALGMGQGVQDSGRALKLKLLRTIAKVRRKRTYYDIVLKDLLYSAQVIAKEHGIKVQGKELSGEPVRPDIEWQDGLPVDEREQVEIEEMRISTGLSTTADAIQRIDGVEEEVAEKKAKEITEASRLKFEGMQFNNVKQDNTDGKTDQSSSK